jgi:hypothetical protein
MDGMASGVALSIDQNNQTFLVKEYLSFLRCS